MHAATDVAEAFVATLQNVAQPTDPLVIASGPGLSIQAAPFILPVLADRALVMKRFPNGVHAAPFYQHRALHVPSGIRVQDIAAADGQPQLVGGTLAAAGANAVNMVVDRDIDRLMPRTQGRPLVTGLVSPREAMVFAVILEVVAFGDEEGSRFPASMSCSRAIAGTLETTALEMKDAEGVSVAEALTAFGGDPVGIASATAQDGPIEACI